MVKAGYIYLLEALIAEPMNEADLKLQRFSSTYTVVQVLTREIAT